MKGGNTGYFPVHPFLLNCDSSMEFFQIRNMHSNYKIVVIVF